MADSEDVPDLDFSDSECQESVGEIDQYDTLDYSIFESDEEEEEISHPAPKISHPSDSTCTRTSQ